MMRKADDLVALIKQKIDLILAKDTKLQFFLSWINKQSLLTNSCYKLAAVRSFYFAIAANYEKIYFIRDRSSVLQTFKASNPTKKYSNISIIDHFYEELKKRGMMQEIYNKNKKDTQELTDEIKTLNDFVIDIVDENHLLKLLMFSFDSEGIKSSKEDGLMHKIDPSIKPEAIKNQELYNNVMEQIYLALDIGRGLDIAQAYSFASKLDYYLGKADSRHIYLEVNLNLRKSLQNLQYCLPNIYLEGFTGWVKWWKTNSRNWTEKLAPIIIRHCNVVHYWNFNEAEKNLLNQYIYANELLVDCLNSDCYVSREIRQEIDDTLLLPINELKDEDES